MRIVHTSDWHIGKLLSDYSLLEEQSACLFAFADRLVELKADALLIAGDLYDRSVPSAEAVSLLDRLFSYLLQHCNIEIFAIAGNHDSRERIDFGSRLMDKAGLHLCGSISRPVQSFRFEKAGEAVDFHLLPYFEPHHVRALWPDANIRTMQNAFDTVMADIQPTLDLSVPQILIAHGFFSTGHSVEEQVGGSEHITLTNSPFDYIALGHLHGCHPAGNDRIRYAGSPLKYSIDESAQKKQFLILDFFDNKLQSISAEPFPVRRDVRILKGELDELCDRTKQTDFDDYIFAELTDKTIRVGAIQRLKAVFPNALGLKYTALQRDVYEQTAPENKSLSLSPEELFSDFFRFAVEREMTESESADIQAILNLVKGDEKHDSGPADI